MSKSIEDYFREWQAAMPNGPNPEDTWYDFEVTYKTLMELRGLVYVWEVPNELGKICEVWIIPAHMVTSYRKATGEHVIDKGDGSPRVLVRLNIHYPGMEADTPVVVQQ